jgi:hypothetical protein
LSFRDGLIVALPTIAPMRRRNLASLALGRHLVRGGRNWSILLSADEPTHLKLFRSTPSPMRNVTSSRTGNPKLSGVALIALKDLLTRRSDRSLELQKGFIFNLINDGIG